MTSLNQTYEAGLVLGDDAEICALQLIAPVESALALFAAGTAMAEARFEGALLTTPSVTVEIEMAETEADGAPALRIGFSVTQHAELASDHPQAAAALLVEILHAGIEATGASHVDWQDALIDARTFQQAVPTVRQVASPEAAIAGIMAEDAAPEDDTPEAAPILLPRRVRPVTGHRACGTAINVKEFETRLATAKRMSQWESFDDYVEAEVAMIRNAPAAVVDADTESLADVFRLDTELPPELMAMQVRKPTLERRVATWALTAGIVIAGLGLHEAVAATLQALAH